MIWLLLIGLGILGIVVVALFFLARPGTAKPAAAHTQQPDLLAQQEEEAFAASVLRKQQERALREIERPKPDPVPDPASEILWEEQDDVYRPAEEDARRFVQTLSLQNSPSFRRGHPLVFLLRSAYDRVQAHLRSDLSIELGGLLVGRAFHDASLDAYFLLIEAAFPADGGEGTAISFEYTSATWMRLTPQLEQMNAEWTVLGSYHSHPGLGVFLSATDRDTQESVFAQDWQAALVIDPIAEETGFFLGEKGVPCPDWHLVETEGAAETSR